MGWDWKDPVGSVGDALGSAADSVGDSISSIVDSTGDFGRALVRGDFGGAISDLASIGWESWNVITNGTLNLIADAIKRSLLPDIPQRDYEDRKVMARNADSPRRVVYGRTRVGGVCRYIESSGDDSNTLHLIVIFAAHSCADIERVYFNGELAFIGTVAQGKFAGKATMIYETGKQTGANAAIVASTPSGWTSNHKLLGQTYAYFKLTYDNEVYRGTPNIDALVKGKDDIYDPRTLVSGWTDNHALVMRDFLLSDYGYKMLAAEMDDATWTAGANICDELVTKGGGQTEKRYTANGSFSIIDSPKNALDGLLAAGVAGMQYVQGKVRYIPGKYEAPAVAASFSESDFWSGLQIVPTANASDRMNGVRGTFIDPSQDYEAVDFVPLVVDEYVIQDKQELITDSKFPWANSGTVARRCAKILLERSRYGVSLSATMSWRIMEYGVGDRIKISIDGLGWTDKIFRIESLEFGIDGADVVLREDGPDVWDWTETDALPVDVPPALVLPNPLFVGAPTGVTASESLYVANDLKTVRSRITIAWNGVTTAQRYEIQGSYSGGAYVTLSDFLTAPIYEFDDAEVGEWSFRVRAVNSLGSVSAWTQIAFTSIGKTAPPENVSQFRGSIRPFGIELLWSPVADLDLDYYEIRLGNTWETATFLQRLQATRWQWETRPNGTEKLLIKAFDTSGNESTAASVAELIIRGPNAVTISPQVIDNNVLLRWTDATTSFSIDRYEVRRGAVYSNAQTVGTVRSTFSNIFETEAGTYTYWIAAIDVAGNVSDPASVVVNVDQPPDFTLLANQSIPLDTGTAVNMVSDLSVTEFTADSTEITADSTQWTADALNKTVLIGPANTSETWVQHFEGLPGWASFYSADDTTWTADSTAVTADNAPKSIQELQLDNGYPLYLQPTPDSASYEVVIDFGAVIGLSRVRLAPDVDIVAGSPELTWFIALSEDGVTYDEQETLDRVGVNFRYVRIRVEIASASGIDLARINDAILRLDVKLRTDQGTAIAVAGDAGGTVVFFNVPLVDVQSIVLTPQGTTPAIMLYDFVDAPNPVSFKALAFDTAGNRITQPFSWTVRGV